MDEHPSPPGYQVHRILRRSVNGTIYSAIDSRTGTKVRLERIHAFYTDGLTEEDVRETQLLRHFRAHRMLSTLERVFWLEASSAWADVYRVHRWYDMDLGEILQSSSVLTESHARTICQQLVSAVATLHDAGVVHGDIRPQAVLINRECEVCLRDYRRSADVDELASLAGAPGEGLPQFVVHYWAPERLCDERRRSVADDAWALGCVVAEVLQRHALLPGQSLEHQLRLVAELLGVPPADELRGFIESRQVIGFLAQQPQDPALTLEDKLPGVRSEFIDVLASLLQFNPAKRPPMRKLVSHHCFGGSGAQPAANAGGAADVEARVAPFRFLAAGQRGLTAVDDLRLAMWDEASCFAGAVQEAPPRFWLRPSFSGESDPVPSLGHLALSALMAGSAFPASRGTFNPAGLQAPASRASDPARAPRGEVDLESFLVECLPREVLLAADGPLSRPSSLAALARLPRLLGRVQEAIRAGDVGESEDALRTLVHSLRASSRPPHGPQGQALRTVAGLILREVQPGTMPDPYVTQDPKKASLAKLCRDVRFLLVRD